MRYSVTLENEKNDNGTPKQYDIFYNHPTEKTYYFPPHIHSYFEILFVLGGELICDIDGEIVLNLYEGDVIFIPPNVIHATYRRPENDMKCIVVKFSPLYLYPMETTDSDLNCLLISPVFTKKYYVFEKNTKIASELGEIMRNCLQEIKGRAIGFELALRGHLISLYVALVRNCQNNPPQISNTNPSEIETNSAQQLHTILTFLKDNYQYDISMQAVADSCGMNYYNFSRFFKKMTNRKFNDYLMEMRLNSAQKKLLQEDKSVIEIAMECGFNNISYFIRKFKEKTGLTPNAFRQKYCS